MLRLLAWFAPIICLGLLPNRSFADSNHEHRGSLAETKEPALPERTRIAVEALSRLKGIPIESNAAVQGAIFRILDQTRGSHYFVEIVRDFGLRGREPELLEYALAHPRAPEALEAVRLVMAHGRLDLVRATLARTNSTAVADAAELVGKTGDPRTVSLIEPLLTDTKRDHSVHQAALRGLAQTKAGAQALLELAQADRLPSDVRLLAATELNLSHWPEIKKAAEQVLPLPQAREAQPLPPINELVKRRGDPKRGEQVFFRQESVCSTCHQINGRGADFCPNLSEIGTKLGRDAIYEAILDPSAGISVGYEGWELLLKNGDDLFGILASNSADELILKSQTGALTRVKKSDIAQLKQMKESIMPAGLQQTMTTQDLVDLVEFLSSLKKK